MFDVAHIDEGILQKTTRQVLLWRNEQPYDKELERISRQECDSKGTL